MAGKNKIKILVSCICAVLAASMMMNCVFAFDEEENSREQERLREENSQYREEIEETDRNISEKEKYSEELQQQIAELSRNISESNNRISELNTRIKKNQAIIDEKTEQVADRLQLLRERLRAIYMAGEVSSLEIILQAKDFSDLIDKMELVKSISNYDDNLISNLQKEMDQISEEQKQLRKDKADVESEKKELESAKDLINQLSQENEQIIEELQKSKSDAEEEIKQNEDRQKELEAALEKYNREIAEKLKAQREKANNETRQEAEEERQNQSVFRDGEGNVIVVESDGGYVWPCPGHTYLTSLFEEWRGSNNHGALDIADGSVYGAQVVACTSGTVFATDTDCSHDWGKFSSCGCGGGYGNYVMIDHGDGKMSIYGHLSGVTVSPGQSVVGGQLIGYVGSTGYSTGPHLHFELRYNGVRYDPMLEY